MKILAIDTSGQQAGAAIVKGKEDAFIRGHVKYITVGEILLNARLGEDSYTHSEILMPGIEQLFRLTRLKLCDIDYIAYTNGPGSFTGLRIGAAAALGLARALEVPAVAVPTLDAAAYNVLGTGTSGLVMPMLDARRGQVYTAVYERGKKGSLTRRTEYMALPVNEALELLPEASGVLIFLGDGADAYAEVLREKRPDALFAPANSNRQRAASAGVLAAEKINSGCIVDDKIDIIYVRAPQAVRSRGQATEGRGQKKE